jgi:ribosomal protein S18 acetylase RimI-like enzyme
MITELDLQNPGHLHAIFTIQRAAYTIEAELIGSFEIPALHESLEDLQQSGEVFLGYWFNNQLAGAISSKCEGDVLDIHRLIVDPPFFRRGIGNALVQSIIAHTEPEIKTIIVSTGARNLPAKKLYTQLGFREQGDVEVIPNLWITQFALNVSNEA